MLTSEPAYVTTTLLHVRPLCSLHRELLLRCTRPASLDTLVVYSGLSAPSVVWLLSDLMRRGLIRRIESAIQPSSSRRG